MSEFYRIFSGTDLYSDPQNITAHEPATRLPYPLYGPTVVTHFPLFYKSREDYNFLQRCQQLRRFQPVRQSGALKAEEKRLSVQEYCSFSDSEVSEIVQSLGPIEEEIATEAVIFILHECNHWLSKLKEDRPSLFV